MRFFSEINLFFLNEKITNKRQQNLYLKDKFKTLERKKKLSQIFHTLYDDKIFEKRYVYILCDMLFLNQKK